MIVTTGIQNAPVVCRHNLLDFLADKEVTNLYVLAMDRMMGVKQDDPSSWFQVAAIHGRPYIPFDGVGKKGNFVGYCTHSSVLFPSWHRPYLALCEQLLSKHVFEIAKEYKNPADKEKYLKAAERFRLPYWDWASESTLPEEVATREKMDVYLPDGTTVGLRNPLFGYEFHPGYSDQGAGLPGEKKWELWGTTVRYPTTQDAKAKSDPVKMQTTLKNNRLTLRNRTYNILSQIKDYSTFSHDATGALEPKPGEFDSIESIHNQIHVLAGMDGHMGEVDYAAFDPVFWLHHVNVDRLFAIWQALNPDVYVTPLKNAAGTFTRPPGETENVDSPLTPFRRTADTWWDSNGVRDTRAFCYTYPELERIQALSKEEKILQLRREVNRLYGRTAPVSMGAPSVFKELTVPPTGVVSGIVTAVTGVVGGVATATGGVVTGVGTVAIGAVSGAGQAVGGVVSGVGQATAGIVGGVTGVIGGVTGAKAPEAPAPAPAPAPVRVHNPAPVDLTHYHEWIANIVVEKYALKSTFLVHIFLGEVPSDPLKWAHSPNLVGSHVIFANNADFTGCERCRFAHEAHKLVTGTIPLTSCLATRLGDVNKLNPENVLPYLDKHLDWRVQKHDDTPVHADKVPGLKVSVGHCVVSCPGDSGEFPTWGDITLHTKVTSGRAGGHR